MEKIDEVIYNENLHFEHRNWISELHFWKDELKTFNNRLSELVTRYTNAEVLKQLEHHQNQFALHKGIIDDLEETIEKHEARIAGQSKTGKEALDVSMAKNHIAFREKMQTQRNIYNDEKKAFFKFLGKYM
ncbi:hypothetical protein ACFQZJ_07615 [Maribacter chungangensis]|uniref:Uncharacterized protein n=1 Tax=Maribacter chungangensis TaxID=1069117 RepID=A0ABW3B2I7_9FLAO